LHESSIFKACPPAFQLFSALGLHLAGLLALMNSYTSLWKTLLGL